jgi:adenine-specific DNA-methyltransferase
MAVGVPKRVEAREQRSWLEYDGKRPEYEYLVQPQVVPVSIFGTSPNSLFFGDNNAVLRYLLTEYRGKVRLVYIDPPYATQTVFHSRNQKAAYEDILTGAHYLEFLRERLLLLHELLAPDGSIYLHLDAKMVFAAKLLMDEIFGEEHFLNMITRKKCNPKNYTRHTYGNVSDYILFYSKSEKYIWNQPLEPWTTERAKEYRYSDAKGRYMKVPIHAPGTRNGATGQPWRGQLPPPGKHWQYTPETLENMDAAGELVWSANGNPRRKVYLDENAGIAAQDIWLDFKDAHNQNIHITGYPTEKNPSLLERIIRASSNAGDLILDAFAGSGTTLAVAAQLERRWFGIDNSPEAIRTMLQRFRLGTAPMGDFVGKRGKAVLDDMDALFTLEPTLFSLSAMPHLEPEAIELARELGYL